MCLLLRNWLYMSVSERSMWAAKRWLSFNDSMVNSSETLIITFPKTTIQTLPSTKEQTTAMNRTVCVWVTGNIDCPSKETLFVLNCFVNNRINILNGQWLCFLVAIRLTVRHLFKIEWWRRVILFPSEVAQTGKEF